MGVGGIGGRRPKEVEGATGPAAAGPEAPATALPATAAPPPPAMPATSSACIPALANDPAALAFQARVGAAAGRAPAAPPALPAAPAAGPSSPAGRARALLGAASARLSEAASDVRRAVDRAGDVVRREAKDGVRAAGQVYERAARELGELRRDVARATREIGERVVDAGERGLRAVGRELGLDDARRAVERGLETGRALVGAVRRELDPRGQIARLDSSGDYVSVSLGGFAQAAARGEVDGGLMVVRMAGGYDVTVSGECAVGVIGQLGGSAGAEAQASATGMLRAGGHVTLSFKTADEAARAVEAIVRIAAPAVEPSAADRRFLGDHLSWIEVRGGAAGEIAGDLGVGGALGLEAGASASADAGVRLTFPERDAAGQVTRGPKVTVLREGTVAVSGGASAGGGSLGAAVSATVLLERTVELPREVAVGALLRDPRGTMRDFAARSRASPAELTILGDARRSAGVGALDAAAGADAGRYFTLTASGDPAALGAAARRALGGDVAGSVSSLGGGVAVDLELQSVAGTSVGFAPDIQAFGVGLGLEAQYLLEDYGPPTRIRVPADRAAAEVRRFLTS